MDTSTIRLALLQRNPAMTPQQFSQHWLMRHAPLVVPLFRYSGTLAMSRHVISPPFSSPTPSQCQLSPTLPLEYLIPLTYPLSSRTSLLPRSVICLSHNKPAPLVPRPADEQRPEPRRERVGRRGWVRPP
jgi:hypothetical protein